MSLLKVEQLSVQFGSFDAVKAISFEVNPGEMLALVGESGSGKSLTALSCLGLTPPTATLSGRILFDGKEVMGASSSLLHSLRGGEVGMIFQEPMTALNPLHTIGRQIGEAITTHTSLPTAQVKARITELLEQVGLAHFKARLTSYPHQLSGGERQRVMIAMAIANKPSLLIADEPTTAVDVTIQAKILTLLKELQSSLGMAILFITHDLTIVRRLADRVAVMKQGEIVEQGDVKRIFSAPQHSYTRHLLASEPKGMPVPAPKEAKTLLSAEGVKVFFPLKRNFFGQPHSYIKAVNNVSITLTESSTLGIVGESGSGKSTFGFALLRLIKSQGRIVFMGQNIHEMPGFAIKSLRKHMQLVFQDPYASLNPRMNIRQIIEEGLLIHESHASSAERLAAIEAILQEVGLSADCLNRYPHEFSGGQRQRISIARAMVLKPSFVVLDEPTSALDLTIQSQIIELLKSLQEKHKLSYLFISHDLRVVRAISHRIAVMHAGEIIETGDSESLFAAPQHDYTKKLIEAAFMKG